MRMAPNIVLKPITSPSLLLGTTGFGNARKCPRRYRLSLRPHAKDSTGPPPSNDPGRPSQNTEGKPLKINTDLKVYSSRLKRIHAQRIYDPQRRKEAYAESEKGYKEVLRRDPTDGRAYVGLGKLLFKQRRYEEARRLYAAGSAATEGTNPFIWTSWGKLEAKCGFPPRARKYYDAALVACNTHQAAWHGWGLMEEQEGNYEKARDLWIRGINSAEKHKKQPSEYLYSSLATLALRFRKYSEAREWFMRGTKTIRGFKSYALWHGWGKLEVSHGRKSTAPKLFRQALKVNPRCRYTHLSWAMMEKSRGRIDTARKVLARANQLNPTDAIILQAWGVMEGEEGNILKARDIFKTGTKIAPDYQELWQAWGVMEFREGNFKEARDIFQQGIWVEPMSRNASFIFQAWGVLEQRQGNPQFARELFRQGVEADPKNMKLWDCWVYMEEEMGFYVRASEIRNLASQQLNASMPKSFTTLKRAESTLEPLLEKVSDWFEDLTAPQTITDDPATDTSN